MNYKPQDLKLIALKDLPPGTVAEFIGRKDIPFVWRLTDIDGKENRLLVLGGEHSFEAISWSQGDDLMRVICDASELRFTIGKPNPQLDPREPGALVVREGGAYINSSRDRDMSYRNTKIDVATFSELERGGTMDEFQAYSDWEIGKLDHNDELQAFFSRRSPKTLAQLGVA